MQKYDVIVVGGGHAGCEAAAASSRLGACTLLITMQLENLGEMSCNPAIGGIAKGTIVREIDALGGIMGLAIDRSGIHYKMLNQKKGAAVWGPRAQADRKLYKQATRALLQSQSNLTIMEDVVEEILSNQSVHGVVTAANGKIFSKRVILTVGTFLNGIIHIGNKTVQAGRAGEQASIHLAQFLKQNEFKMGRLKTGTPARIHKDSIKYSVLEEQKGDIIAKNGFSYFTDKITRPQFVCFIAKTNAATRKIIQKNIKVSAMYSGQITPSVHNITIN